MRPHRVRATLVLIVGCVWALAQFRCGAGAPTPPPPAPLAAVVSFGMESVSVFEGETVEVPIRYETRELDVPIRLRVSPILGTASAADIQLPSSALVIPAGRGTTGEVTFSLVGVHDLDFEEGTETLFLRFVPDPSVNVQYGVDLSVTIAEGGVILSFGESSIKVFEGETVEIPIDYETRNLASKALLGVVLVPGTAMADDLALVNPFVEIPPGRGMSGSVSVSVKGLPDENFDEGTESLELMLLANPSVSARLGGALPVSVREGGVLVSFGNSAASVCEGELLEVPVRYELRHLASSWDLKVSASRGTAEIGDYSLAQPFVRIPAGKGVTGEVSLDLTAVADSNRRESPELLTLAFVPDSRVSAQLGRDLSVTIRERSSVPPRGLQVTARRPVLSDDRSGRIGAGHRFTGLTIERQATAKGAAMFLRAPYYLRTEGSDRWQSIAATRVGWWRVDRAGETVRHQVHMEWADHPRWRAPDLEVVFRGGACSGDIRLTCSSHRCRESR